MIAAGHRVVDVELPRLIHLLKTREARLGGRCPAPSRVTELAAVASHMLARPAVVGEAERVKREAWLRYADELGLPKVGVEPGWSILARLTIVALHDLGSLVAGRTTAGGYTFGDEPAFPLARPRYDAAPELALPAVDAYLLATGPSVLAAPTPPGTAGRPARPA
jgi:hypothetical protein